MVQVDVFLSAAVGGTAAWVSRRALARDRNAPLVANTILASAVLAPLMLMFLLLWPAWDTMYVFSDGNIPVWLGPVFYLAVVLANAAAFNAVQRAIVDGKDAKALAIPALCLLPPGVICAVWPQRWLHVGTVESFQSGAPFNILQSGVPWALIAVGAVMGGGLAWQWRRSRN